MRGGREEKESKEEKGKRERILAFEEHKKKIEKAKLFYCLNDILSAPASRYDYDQKLPPRYPESKSFNNQLDKFKSLLANSTEEEKKQQLERIKCKPRIEAPDVENLFTYVIFESDSPVNISFKNREKLVDFLIQQNFKPQLEDLIIIAEEIERIKARGIYAYEQDKTDKKINMLENCYNSLSKVLSQPEREKLLQIHNNLIEKRMIWTLNSIISSGFDIKTQNTLIISAIEKYKIKPTLVTIQLAYDKLKEEKGMNKILCYEILDKLLATTSKQDYEEFFRANPEFSKSHPEYVVIKETKEGPPGGISIFGNPSAGISENHEYLGEVKWHEDDESDEKSSKKRSQGPGP